jgi:malate permease and related proteins
MGLACPLAEIKYSRRLHSMTEVGPVLGAVIPVFMIMGAGFVLRRVAWLTAEADKSLLKLTVNVLLPCLILDAAFGNPALSQWRNLVLAPLVGALTVGLGWTASRFAARSAGLETDRARRTFTLAVGLYNYGFVPIPLAILLFGPSTVGVLFLHNLGVESALWTVGVMVLTGARAQIGYRQLINAPLVAMVLALTVNFSGAYPYVPKVLSTSIHLLGQCAIPLSLILAGAIIDDHLEEFHSRAAWRVIATAVALRLAILPVLFLLLARYLPVSLELKRVIVLQAAMPSAVFPIVMAKHFGGDPPTALRVVLGTSLVGLLTMPLWIRVGLAWIGGS